MENFLTENQIKTLKEKKWNVLPKGAYITLYKDEFRPDIWEMHCKTLGEDPDKDKILILIFGTND
jgi:hypothetical protein